MCLQTRRAAAWAFPPTGTVTLTIPQKSQLIGPARFPQTPSLLVVAIGLSVGLLLAALRAPAQKRAGMVLSVTVLAVVVGAGVSCGGGGGGGSAGTATVGTGSPSLTFDSPGFVAGQASITVTPMVTETIMATYGGDTNYTGSTSSNSVTITVQ